MRVCFFSNYLSHHQLPFCLEMQKLPDVEFMFVATTPISQSRVKFGYADMNHAYPFVLTAYESSENEEKAVKAALEADVVIIGSAPDRYIIPRLKQRKLTFKYSERFYKAGLNYKTFFHAAAGAWLHHGRFQRYPLYMLCASAYTAGDCAVFGNYRGRTYKWGYFPEVKEENLDELFRKRQEKQKATLLWAGRLLNWKHPEMAIRLAEHLKAEQYDFELQIIGNGKMEEPLKHMIREKQLGDCVSMLGAMSPEAVREHMEAADIFLFTSDFNEGWGAVLNEAMNSGCAVVASHAIGSVPFLICDGENGRICESGNQNQLDRIVMKLLDHPDKAEAMGRAAYDTMVLEWNAHIAAERFLKLAGALEKKQNRKLFSSGPCSPAEILKNDWYKENSCC